MPRQEKHTIAMVPVQGHEDNDPLVFNAGGSSEQTSITNDNSQEKDVEDGLGEERQRTKRRPSWASFWRPLPGRSWWKGSRNAMYEDVPVEEGLQNTYTQSQLKRKGYNCYFGGRIGIVFIATFLGTNLLLTIAIFFWTLKIGTSLQRSGQDTLETKEHTCYESADLTRDVAPIPCHSHNDYWRDVPLFSAIRTGCIGVEADVSLFENELYVGHNLASLTRNRTFQSLYVDPLVKILEQRNVKTDFFTGTIEGVFEEHPSRTLTLLVDLKTEGAETWPVVLKQLQPLRDRGWLSFVENGKVYRRPITVVGSGNAPFDLITANSTYRDTFFDALLETMWEPAHTAQGSPRKVRAPVVSRNTRDIGKGRSGTSPNSQFMKLNSYYASVSFKATVGKISGGKLSKKQISIIQGQVRGAHKRGLKARYWETPDWPLELRNHVWDTLIREGVDLLNVDDLKGASELVW